MYSGFGQEKIDTKYLGVRISDTQIFSQISINRISLIANTNLSQNIWLSEFRTPKYFARIFY